MTLGLRAITARYPKDTKNNDIAMWMGEYHVGTVGRFFPNFQMGVWGRSSKQSNASYKVKVKSRPKISPSFVSSSVRHWTNADVHTVEFYIGAMFRRVTLAGLEA